MRIVDAVGKTDPFPVIEVKRDVTELSPVDGKTPVKSEWTGNDDVDGAAGIVMAGAERLPRP